MSETVKVTGTIGEYGDGERFPLAVRFDVELPLRDLFAAFALTAVVGLDLEDASHKTDAIYAYAAADAMLEVRALSARGHLQAGATL